MQMRIVLWSACILALAQCAPHAEEAKRDRSEDLKSLVQKLGGQDQAASLNARNALFQAPFEDLKPLLPLVVKAVKNGSQDHDHAYQLLSLLGPDCGDLLPGMLTEIRTEKDPLRRGALVVLIGRLGATTRDSLRELRTMQRDDQDPGVRALVTKTISRVDYSDAKAAETLRLLGLEKYASVREQRAAWEAMEDVQKRWGASVELIRALTRWTLTRASQSSPPHVPETEAFYEYGVGTLRIGLPVIKEAIEGKDENMRAAALELLAKPVLQPRSSAWYACHELVGLMESPSPAVRSATARQLADIRKHIPNSWLPNHPISTAVPKLREVWFKEKDMSVAKACREALELFSQKEAASGPAQDKGPGTP